MPVVVGRVVELPELLIAQLFIEAACLKAERVEPCRVTATLAGADFRSIHQLAPHASTAQCIRYPEVSYEQPPAIDLTREPGDDLQLEWADLVMTGGMLPQRSDTLTVIALAQTRGKPVVVGGPDATSSPEIYEVADFRVLGEAEGIIDEFIAAWDAGARKGTFTAEKFAIDITKTPIPRFDLLKRDQYIYYGVQFARGCPFTCEFCDIIELYGRAPRVKTAEQILAELDTLYRTGYRGHLDFVDDNFIGNKKAVKAVLPHLIAWQKAHGYPFEFSTEASINLADDAALLALMREANFFVVFVGIESPDTDTLILTQKKQNTRRSLAESVHKIYAAGMYVLAGFIVGFDSEKASVADAMIDCIEATSIPVCMIGLLYSLPNTQLNRRLEREGRVLTTRSHRCAQRPRCRRPMHGRPQFSDIATAPRDFRRLS